MPPYTSPSVAIAVGWTARRCCDRRPTIVTGPSAARRFVVHQRSVPTEHERRSGSGRCSYQRKLMEVKRANTRAHSSANA